jgi:hypothetical protein
MILPHVRAKRAHLLMEINELINYMLASLAQKEGL